MGKISNLPTKHTFGNLQNVKTEMAQLVNSQRIEKPNNIPEKIKKSVEKRARISCEIRKKQHDSERTFQQLLHRSKSQKLPNLNELK